MQAVVDVLAIIFNIAEIGLTVFYLGSLVYLAGVKVDREPT